jgi:hypothetical protein
MVIGVNVSMSMQLQKNLEYKMNTFKVVRVASEITGMTKEEIKLLAELLVTNKYSADVLQFHINVAIREDSLEKEIA